MAIDAGRAVGYLDLDTSGFRRGFSSAMSDMQVFNNRTATSNDRLAGLSSAMTSTGSTLTKTLTLPIVGMGAAIVKTTADFESGMSEVQAISGATGEDMKKLSDKAKEMGATTKFSASESAEALKYMAMAGWDTQKMLDGLPGVMNLAAASGEELGTVSDIVTDALTAFGMKAEEAGHFADVLAKASSKSNTNVGMMGETFKYVAPIAGALGYSAEDTAVAIGLMANAGIKGSQAGTALRGAMTRLAKPTGEASKYMKELNINIANADGSMKPFGDVMDMLRDRFKGLTQEQQAQAASTIFGQEAMSGMLAVINASDEDYKKLTQEIYNADGAAQEMADTMNNNLKGQLTILGSTIEGIALQFGEILLPVIKKIVQGFQDFATWLNNTSEGTKQVIVVIATVLAALGPLLLIGGKLLSGILQIKMLLGATGLALSGLMTPILLIIAGVAALALAWTTNFAGIRDTAKRILGEIVLIVQTVVGTIKRIWEEDLAGIRSTVETIFNAIKIIVEGALGVIEGLVMVFSGVLTGDWEKAWEGVKKIAESVWNTIKELLKLFLKWIIDRIIDLAASLYVKGKEAMQKLGDGFKEIWETIKEWTQAFIDDPIGTLKRLAKLIYNKGKDVINSLWKGLKSAWNSVKDWFQGIADWVEGIWDSIKKKFNDAVSTKEKASALENSSGGKKKTKGYAKGLPYVPYDGFPAILHKGERVLTAKEADAYNGAKSTGSGVYEFNFYSPQELSPAEQARQFKKTMNQILFEM